jgi:hypothetical protein
VKKKIENENAEAVKRKIRSVQKASPREGHSLKPGIDDETIDLLIEESSHCSRKKEIEERFQSLIAGKPAHIRIRKAVFNGFFHKYTLIVWRNQRCV